MSVTRFCLLNDTERKLLARKLQQAVANWQGDWFSADVPSSTALANLVDNPVSRYRWMRGSTPRGLSAAVGVPVDADWGLGFALTALANTAANSAGGDIARALEIELLRGLIRALLMESGRADPLDPVTWSDGIDDDDSFDAVRGFVCAEYQLRGSHAGLVMMLYPETTSAYLATLERAVKPAGAMVPAGHALESQPVRVEVVAGEAELLLQELATLAVGDVVRLDRNIAQPLQLVISGGEAISAAHLGAAGDQKAVQLSSSRH